MPNEELNGLYSSPNIIRVIKLIRMRWTEHVARMGRGKLHIGFWWENLREIDNLEDLGVDERIILRWIFWKWDGDVDWIDMAQEKTGGGSCKRVNKHSVSIKYREFVD